LRLSLLSKKKVQDIAAAAADPLGGIQPGAVYSGTVSGIHTNDDGAPTYFDVLLQTSPKVNDNDADVASPGQILGRLEVAHLADHPAAAEALTESIQVGTHLDGLLVLQRLEKAKQLRVTRKASLIAAAAAGTLPDALTCLTEGTVVPGYVASVAADAVFVRFLGDLTGRAGLAQLSDTFISDPRTHFSPGQSVRARVAHVDAVKGRFSLTLKQSLCGIQDGAYLRSSFADAELAHRLALAAEEGDDGGGADFDWGTAFPLGRQGGATQSNPI